MEKLDNKTIQNVEKRGKHAKEKVVLVDNTKGQQNKKKEENDKKENKKLEKVLIAIIIALTIFTFVLDIYYIYTKLIPKFKNIQLEIGYEKELSIKDFITNEKYLEDSKILTDLTGIDLNKVRRI